MEPQKQTEQVAAAYWRNRCQVAERALRLAGPPQRENEITFGIVMTELRSLRRVMDGDI